MAGNTVYRVSIVGDVYKIELAGDSVIEYAPTKAEAIARAKVLVRRSLPGRVVVLARDGRVEQEIEIDNVATT